MNNKQVDAVADILLDQIESGFTSTIKMEKLKKAARAIVEYYAKPSAVIEIGEQKGEIPEEIIDWIDAWKKKNIVSAPRDWQVHSLKTVWAAAIALDLYRYLAPKISRPSHPAPAPIVGERDKKTECTCICGPIDTNPICTWPNCFKPEEKTGDSVAPTERILPEDVRAFLTQRFTKEYFLKVTVSSDLLPENQGNVRANISTGIYSAFSGPGWVNTGVSVEELADIQKELDQEIQKIADRKKDYGSTYKNHFNEGADWAFKKIKALITK